MNRIEKNHRQSKFFLGKSVLRDAKFVILRVTKFENSAL